MNNISIRPARDSDAEQFLEILNISIREVAHADYSSDEIESWVIPIDEKSLAWYVKNPNHERRILAQLNGEFVGIGAATFEKCELRACYVAPKGLRHGVGTAMVHELEQMAQAEGLDYLQLHATITAEPFYKALGYTTLKRTQHPTRGGLSIAAISMTKNFY